MELEKINSTDSRVESAKKINAAIDAIGNGELANKDLSNLTEEGEKHFLGKSQITNCLLEVPQRINLELNNGTLTLKAGSEVIVPNGKNADGSLKFDYVTVESDKDISSGTTTAGQRFIWFTLPNSNGNGITQYCFSGNTSVMNSTTPNTYSTFYNTETNKIYRGNGTTWVERQYSLPVCLATNDTTGAFTSIDQVFNGFGYIGSHWWVDKGVKGLIPNGRNKDGSLNNIERTTGKLLIYQCGGETLNWFLMTDLLGNKYRNAGATTYYEQNERPVLASNVYGSWYNPTENKFYTYNTGTWAEAQVLIVAKCSTTDGKVTGWYPETAFRAVDYNDAVLKSTPHITQTYKNGTSGYRVWSDGYCEQWGFVTIHNETVTLLKSYSDTNYAITLGTADFAGGTYASTVHTRTKSSFIVYTLGNDRNCFWKTCGYIN